MKLPAGHVAGVGVHKATAYGGFGQQMLEKMGWSKGQGLGKQKHGMKEAIEVKKKEDALGVGATSTGWKWDWKYWEDAYNTGLKSLDKSNSKKRKRQASSSSSSDSDSGSESGSSSSSSSDSGSSSSSDSDSDSDSSEDELEARIASVVNRDGTTASASAAELKLAKQLAKDPWGRFGGRDGKMARIRQQEEAEAAAMRAKLGLQQPAPASAAASGDSKKKRRKQEAAAAAGGSSGGEDSSVDTADKAVSKSSSSKKEDSSSSGCDKKSKKQKKGSKDAAADQQQQQQQQGSPPAAGSKQRVVIVIDKLESAAQAAAAAAFKPTPATGWWGAKMFASAGLLEGMDQDQQQRERGFDEDLQTKVYMDAHNAQRVGKKGLGKSTTLKIAGGGWQGKKVTFGEDAGDEDAAGPVQQEQQQATAAAEPAAQHSKGSSKSKIASAAGSDGEETAAGSSINKKKVKWGSLAVKQLQQAPAGGLKWKKLWPLLLAAATEQQRQQGVKAKSAVDEDSKDKAWQKLQSCSKLQIDGKLVTLAA